MRRLKLIKGCKCRIEIEIEREIIVSVKNEVVVAYYKVQGGSNMTGTNCDLFTHKSSRSYLNHLVLFQHLTRGTERNDVSP
jgi:hypothetical protein